MAIASKNPIILTIQRIPKRKEERNENQKTISISNTDIHMEFSLRNSHVPNSQSTRVRV